MHRRLAAAMFLALLLPAAWAAPYTLAGRVVNVHDGDTITLLDAEHRQWRIRLDGIDAPELGQPFGQASRRHLAQLVAGSAVRAECHKSDRYGRAVCQVLAANTDPGLEQVRAGMAWYFRRYANELDAERQEAQDAAERQAQEQRRGLWADRAPVAPWDWRANKGARAAPAP